VYGTLDINGTSGSEVTLTNYSSTVSGEFEGLLVTGSGSYDGVLYADYATFEYGGKPQR